MKLIIGVDPERFDEFAKRSDIAHYSKTSPFIAFKYPEYRKGVLVGMENEQGELVASAVVLQKTCRAPIMKFSYVQYGFNLDISDRALIAEFAKALADYAKNSGSAFLRIDPNITRIQHEKDGRITENGFDHEYVTEILKEQGYTHLGYNYGYSGNWMSRFTYCLDLDRDLKTIRKGIKRYNTYHKKNEERLVTVRRASMEELPVLLKSQKELSEKLGFKPKDLSYFQKLWKAYGDDVYYYIASVNYTESLRALKQKAEELKDYGKKLKDENKIAKNDQEISALEKEIAEISASPLNDGQEHFLGAKFIIRQDTHAWNVNMYTTKTFLNYRGAFALHDYAIAHMHELGVKTYDFEGISGSMDPKDEYYGQTDFKKSFGGDYLEFLGEFDAVFNRRKYEEWKKVTWFNSHARRRIRRVIYSRKKKTS